MSLASGQNVISTLDDTLELVGRDGSYFYIAKIAFIKNELINPNA